MNETSIRVYLCAAESERLLAEAVRDRLEEAGVRVVLPDRKFRNAKNYRDSVADLIRSVDATVFLISQKFAEEDYLYFEGGMAFSLALPIYVLLNDVRSTGIPEFYKQYPTFRLWGGMKKLVRSLAECPETQAA